MKYPMKLPKAANLGCLLSLGLILSACDGDRSNTSKGAASQSAPTETADVEDASSPTQDQPEKKSIIRTDIEQAPAEAPALEPQTLVVPFPEKGAKPDAAGLASIDELIASPIFKAGGKITIWGHSDSGGSDATNLAASRRRAEAVRAYLQGRGAPKERIVVIPMGEDRPIAPNRKLDGSDDAEGRSRNRRVEIRVDLPEPPSDATAGKDQTLSPQ